MSDDEQKKPCDNIENCPITKHFGDEEWQAMLKRYCYGSFEKCYRYQLVQQGQRPDLHIMPWDGLHEWEQ